MKNQNFDVLLVNFDDVFESSDDLEIFQIIISTILEVC